MFVHMKQNEHPCHLVEFTLVIPGKSTRVRLRTLGEKIFKCMGSGLIPWTVWKKKENECSVKSKFKASLSLHQGFPFTLLSPELRSVSISISWRISWKSVKICQKRWETSTSSKCSTQYRAKGLKLSDKCTWFLQCRKVPHSSALTPEQIQKSECRQIYSLGWNNDNWKDYKWTYIMLDR